MTLLAGATVPAVCGAQAELGRMLVQMTGFESDAGHARVALVNRREQFLSRDLAPFRSAAVPIRDKQAHVVFEQLPQGEYAISVFHDANDNGELDSNLLRIPKEAYGFSNDARGTFGPPGYDAARFRFDRPQQRVAITVR